MVYNVHSTIHSIIVHRNLLFITQILPYLQTISRFQKSWQLLLTNINLSCIHKFKNRLQMTEWYILKYNNWMF